MRVRMGIHTGDAARTGDGGYVGLAVHLAARITALGHGGQILVSDTARRLVGDGLDGVSFLDLGLHTLADFPDPVRIHQVQGPDAEFFAPLQSAVERPLPATAGRLFGRDDEIPALVDLIDSHRLVTVLGPGGTGKTRLVIEAARRLRSHGVPVHFVDLTGVASVELMPSYVGAVVGAAQDPDVSPVRQIATTLGGSSAILAVDNCEHLMPEVARFVVGVLEAHAGARILATSRSPLAVPGERLFDLAPLVVVTASEGASPAVALFVDRATDVVPEFTLDDTTLPHVQAIVTRLDGLPLAIELAVSMLRVLPIEELASVLAHRLDLLEGGAARPDRHRSLAAALRWNVESLDERTRRAFMALGVMTGPFSIDDLGGVVGVGSMEAIQIASRLAEYSLVTRTVSDGRSLLGMLETIRWHALELLGPEAEESAARDRHLARFLDVALEARTNLRTPEAATTLGWLWPRRSNVLAAIDHAIAIGRLEEAVTLVEGLVDAWAVRAAGREARIATTKVLDAVSSESPELELRAIFARLEVWQSPGIGIAVERRLAERAFALARESGDRGSRLRTRIWMIEAGVLPAVEPRELMEELERVDDPRVQAYGLDAIGWMLWWQDRQKEAADTFRRLRRISIAAGDPIGTLDATAGVIATARTPEEFAEAARLVDETSETVQRLRCGWWEGFHLQYEASHSRRIGQLGESAEWLARAYRAARERGTINQVAFVTADQAVVAWSRGDIGTMYAKLLEFAEASAQVSDIPFNPFVLEMAAGVAVGWDQKETAARLCGAAEAWRLPGGLTGTGMPLPAWDEDRHRDVLLRIESALPGGVVRDLKAEGAALSPSEALEIALTLRPPD